MSTVRHSLLENIPVKTPHRSVLLATGLALAFAALARPTVANAQRQQLPGPDTKKVLVTTFRGDVAGGVRAADEIRNRIQGEYSIKTLMPISKKDIDANLQNAGYTPDSALAPQDNKELARILRADEIIDGVVVKTATGYRVQARMFLPRDLSLSQPLGTFESKDFGDIAKQVVDEYDRARKQIPDNQACENGIRSNTPSVAIAAALKGVQNYNKSTLTRLCLASVYASMRTTADSTGPWKDSVISIANEIVKLDPTNTAAIELAYGAYNAKADKINAMRMLIALMNADPTNTERRKSAIIGIVNLGEPDSAARAMKPLVDENPGDAELAKTYWQILRAAKRYKEAVSAGIAWVTIDTASADSAYYFRQISDLAADSAYAKAVEFADRASAKYPTRVDFLLLKAQNERKSGQLPAAKLTLERILKLDPKAPLAAAQLATIDNDLGQVDEAVKVLKADYAADPSNKDRDAALLLSFGKKLYDAAAASKLPTDYLKAVPVLQASDEIAPSENASFFIAVSVFQAIASNPETMKALKTCEDFKGAADMLSLVSIHMPRGGRVSPETAKQILGYLPQLQTFVDGSARRVCAAK